MAFVVMVRFPEEGKDERHPFWKYEAKDPRFDSKEEATTFAKSESLKHASATVVVRDEESNVSVCSFRNGTDARL